MNIKNNDSNKNKNDKKTGGLKIPKNIDKTKDDKSKYKKNKQSNFKLPELNFIWIDQLRDFITLRYMIIIVGVLLSIFVIYKMDIFEVVPELINSEVVATDSEQDETATGNPINKYDVTEDFYNALINEGIIAADYVEVNGEMDHAAAQEFAVQYKNQTGISIKPEYNNCNFDTESYLDLLSDGNYGSYEEKFLSESQECNITTDDDLRIYLGYLDLNDANEITSTSMNGGYTMEELSEELKNLESPDVYISVLMRCPEVVIAGELINNEAYVPSYTGETVTINEVEVDDKMLEDINEELNYAFTGVYQYKITTETDGEKDVWVATVLTNGGQCYLYDMTLTSEDYTNYKQAKLYLQEN